MTTFEQKLAAILRRADEGRDYVKSLASWQIANGLNGLDLTPEQTQRFRAVEKAGGDVRAAKGLIYGRLRYRRGALSDG